jgi:hypothetical protein
MILIILLVIIAVLLMLIFNIKFHNKIKDINRNDWME